MVRWKCHTPLDRKRGAHLPFPGHWARRWLYHWVCDAWPGVRSHADPRLPSQPQSIAALWLVSNYTAWWQRDMCVNNLPSVVTWRWNSGESNRRPLDRPTRSNTLTVKPTRHTRSGVFRGGPCASATFGMKKFLDVLFLINTVNFGVFFVNMYLKLLFYQKHFQLKMQQIPFGDYRSPSPCNKGAYMYF